ncbi:MAG TPA: hypothetical protein VM290_00675 [Gaiellaceae bacterium]|nr:hypothetical protein [Gaiellaceae bacterium]
MIVAVTSLFLFLGIVIGRWWIVAVPLVLWPVWFLVQWRWGAGLGDLWWAGFLAVLLSSLALSALGVSLRRAGFGHRRRGALPK